MRDLVERRRAAVVDLLENDPGAISERSGDLQVIRQVDVSTLLETARDVSARCAEHEGQGLEADPRRMPQLRKSLDHVVLVAGDVRVHTAAVRFVEALEFTYCHGNGSSTGGPAPRLQTRLACTARPGRLGSGILGSRISGGVGYQKAGGRRSTLDKTSYALARARPRNAARNVPRRLIRLAPAVVEGVVTRQSLPRNAETPPPRSSAS